MLESTLHLSRAELRLSGGGYGSRALLHAAEAELPSLLTYQSSLYPASPAGGYHLHYELRAGGRASQLFLRVAKSSSAGKSQEAENDPARVLSPNPWGHSQPAENFGSDSPGKLREALAQLGLAETEGLSFYTGSESWWVELGPRSSGQLLLPSAWLQKQMQRRAPSRRAQDFLRLAFNGGGTQDLAETASYPPNQELCFRSKFSGLQRELRTLLRRARLLWYERDFILGLLLRDLISS